MLTKVKCVTTQWIALLIMKDGGCTLMFAKVIDPTIIKWQLNQHVLLPHQLRTTVLLISHPKKRIQKAKRIGIIYLMHINLAIGSMRCRPCSINICVWARMLVRNLWLDIACVWDLHRKCKFLDLHRVFVWRTRIEVHMF